MDPRGAMYKTLLLLSIASTPLLAADAPVIDFSENQKIAVQNSILAKVNGQTISMMDVKKKMDLVFHQYYPQLSHSTQARHQFYESSWRQILMQLIDNELIISDSVDKELKLTDGEVREEVEKRFGPNVMQTLDRIGVTYEETWKMIKNEMVVQRMMWWYVHSRAIQNVTPQDIRQAYRHYLQENPSYCEWTYRVVSIRADKADEKLAEKIYLLLCENGKSPELMSNVLKEFEKEGIAIQVSNEYTATDKELSEAHKTSLAPLTPGQFSKPSFQMSRADKKTVYRIFFLREKMDHPAPSFEAMSNRLRDDLVQKCVADESNVYIEKLRKHYGFDEARIKQTVPEDLHPFSIQ